MICVPINEAEAMLETFWDGGSSEHPGDKLNFLRGYEIEISESASGSVDQIWCAVQVLFEHGTPGSTISMTTSCDIEISAYDIFRIFASVPSWVSISATGRVDGREVQIIDPTQGAGTNDEIEGPISGGRLSWLRVTYTLTEDKPASLSVVWFGLSNKERQEAMESRVSPYSAEWPDLILTSAQTRESGVQFAPSHEILFSTDELASLRSTLHRGHLSTAYRTLRSSAEEYLTWEPEKDIGTHIMNPDRRWVRNRDMGRRSTAGVMEVLAFVGIIEESYEMLRMAARMALSAAHCEYWCESIIGTMPGVTWHHRSFTEEIYCRATALVLDWAGSILTPPARQLLRDAIVMKGLPRIESDFKRMEYIRTMNQGIVFSSGRIFGVLALLDVHPRYNTLLDEAESDLLEMIDAYVQDDGGTLEGMAYWSYTFSTAMPVVYALARHRDTTLQEYATESLRKTGAFGLAMLSTTGDCSTYLPVNDAHADVSYPSGLVAAFTQLSDRAEWHSLHHKVSAASTRVPNIYHLIMAPKDTGLEELPALDSPRFDAFLQTGQMSSVRLMADGSVSQFHVCSGPADGGHYHDDKGSFIINAGGEALAIDRGVTNYHHPEVNLIGIAGRHNLLYPEQWGERHALNRMGAKGAVLTSAFCHDDAVWAASDNLEAWADGLFTRNLRRFFSPSADIIIIDDDIELGTSSRMSFRVNSKHRIEPRDGSVHILGEKYGLKVTPVNWEPEAVHVSVEGVDSHLNPVNLLRMVSHDGAAHRLLTTVELYAIAGTHEYCEYTETPHGTYHFELGDVSYALRGDQDNVLETTIDDGHAPQRCVCNGGIWSMKKNIT